MVLGIIGGVFLTLGQLSLGSIVFSIHTLLYCMMMIILGLNIILFYIFTKLYAENSHFIPNDKSLDKIVKVGEDKGILAGFLITLVGIGLTIAAFGLWKSSMYGEMQPEMLMRLVIPSATLIQIGVELMFASFFIGILRINWRSNENRKRN